MYVWLAFKHAAEELDCNLMVFEGRTFGRKEYVDKQHHIVYNFIEKGVLDGIIITSASIGGVIPLEEFLKFCAKYKGIPTVSFGLEIPGATSIICDNKQGLRDLVGHLIDDHGYKKIMFVTGPMGNSESIERFEAYKEVLEEKNINFDEKLVFQGDFVANTGYRIRKEITVSNMEYDAIIFANDDMALGAIKCIENMKETGRYPLDKKCIICGFDDSINASKVNPPLTTVRQPIKEMCYKSVEVLVEGEVKEELIVFNSVMVKRASCGCDYNKENDNITDNSLVELVTTYRLHENIQTYLVDELFDELTPALKECFIESCFVFKYVEGPIFYDEKMVFDEAFILPPRSEMIYAYYNGERKTIDENNRIIKTTHILPDNFIPDDRRFTYIVLPLFFKNEHFGYMCFEVTGNDVVTPELLRGQISNALKGALMLLERESIEENLRENERLASLGQLIGGISHNLMTPIMSISGATTALGDLIDEYRKSIGDASVTNEDHYEIKSEMAEWIQKLKEYNAYMSNVISAVKSQAAQLNAHTCNNFNIEELVNRIKFLKNTDIIIKKANLELFVEADLRIVIPGDISNMLQVLINLIKNAIQSYEGKEAKERKVELYIRESENMIIIIVKDFGNGIPENTRSSLFKHMATTKGKNGTGLSLLLSYSTIKGKFGGDIWFESEENQGTSFYIAVPAENPIKSNI
jgi:DNA-binding LacI/PurR family transcriptional regulator/signal transduction histidine kinase